ncbi:MAG TPA: hypothetical protein VJ869_02055 [Sphaerochaeta sp.]|nr:hypothetical protein [Sphaerochaeta sp.]
METIAGINHMGRLLSLHDKKDTELYAEIKKRAAKMNEEKKHDDMVRYEYIRRLGYYCTESSEHHAEYNPFFIKARYPNLIGNSKILHDRGKRYKYAPYTVEVPCLVDGTGVHP